jgi:hypothetical protein
MGATRDIMLSEVSHARKDKGQKMWKIDPNDKQIHKIKHEHTQTHK